MGGGGGCPVPVTPGRGAQVAGASAPRQKVAGRVRQGTRRGWGFVVSSRPEGEATNRCFSHIEASPHPPSLNKTPPCGGLEGARCRGPAPATGSSAAANVDVGGASRQAPFTVRAPGGRGVGGGGGVGSPEGGCRPPGGGAGGLGRHFNERAWSQRRGQTPAEMRQLFPGESRPLVD